MIGRVVLAAAVLLVAGCSADGIGGVTVVTHGDHRISTGERIVGSVAIAGGTLVVESGGSVSGDVFVADGALLLRGAVDGSVSALGGRVEAAPTAHVHGSIQVSASAVLEVRPGARLDGGIEEGPMLPEPAADGSPLVQLAWAAARAVVAVLFAALVRRLARSRVRNAAAYLAGMPAASLAYGFLVVLVGISLIVFMAFTIVLIPVALVGLAALASAVILGLAAVIDRLADRFGMGRSLAVTVVGLALIPELPLIGGPATILALLGLVGGAALAVQRPRSPDDRSAPHAAERRSA